MPFFLSSALVEFGMTSMMCLSVQRTPSLMMAFEYGSTVVTVWLINCKTSSQTCFKWWKQLILTNHFTGDVMQFFLSISKCNQWGLLVLLYSQNPSERSKHKGPETWLHIARVCANHLTQESWWGFLLINILVKCVEYACNQGRHNRGKGGQFFSGCLICQWASFVMQIWQPAYQSFIWHTFFRF